MLLKSSTCVSPGWVRAPRSGASCSRLGRSGPSQKLARGCLALGPGLQALFLIGISVRHSNLHSTLLVTYLNQTRPVATRPHELIDPVHG